MTEAAFMAQLLELAQLLGWRSAHFRPCQTTKGWRTAVQGDGAGWPDLVLVRGRRIVAIECKSDKGRLSPDQATWLVALEKAGVETHVWKPADWTRAVEALT